MTIAIADSIHIISTIDVRHETRSGQGRGGRRIPARQDAWPVFLTTVTTMIGFLSLNASDSPPFRVLGNFVAFGVLCAFIYSMTLLPAHYC